MSDAETLARLEAAADEVATQLGGVVDAAVAPDGSWVASIEPPGENYGDWAVTAGGATRAQALSKLIQAAKKHGAD